MTRSNRTRAARAVPGFLFATVATVLLGGGRGLPPIRRGFVATPHMAPHRAYVHTIAHSVGGICSIVYIHDTTT
jgi:hypothetical protein